jgi:hypothetical protein
MAQPGGGKIEQYEADLGWRSPQMSLCWWPAPSIRRVFGRFWASARAPRRTSPAGRHYRGTSSTAASTACSSSSPTPAEAWYGISARRHVPATRVREVSRMLKAIHAQESRDAADHKVGTNAPCSAATPMTPVRVHSGHELRIAIKAASFIGKANLGFVWR